MMDIQEMKEMLGATFFINNNSTKDYDRINGNFVKILDSFLTNDSYGKLNNFDESEKIEMLRQSGATSDLPSSSFAHRLQAKLLSNNFCLC